MSNPIFASMNSQLSPSPQARAALAQRLAQTSPRRASSPWKYGALAACAALLIAAYPIHQALNPPLHSYVSLSPNDTPVTEQAAAGGFAAVGGAQAEGDRDMVMAPKELRASMAESGYSQEEIDAYLSAGYTMTWAKWWKFIHQSEEAGGPTLEALQRFSQQELSVAVGIDIDPAPDSLPQPDGSLSPAPGQTSDAPAVPSDQEWALDAYQRLMERFQAEYGPASYPQWYGGAYLDEHAGLIVLLAGQLEQDGNALELQVQDWSACDRLGFGRAKYSLAYLLDLQEQCVEALSSLGLHVSCGVPEDENRVVLTLSSVTDKALAILAQLDPEDDAILVQVGQAAAAETPAVHHSVQPNDRVGDLGGDLADDGELIATEPGLPDDAGDMEQTQTAVHDLLDSPSQADTAAQPHQK